MSRYSILVCLRTEAEDDEEGTRKLGEVVRALENLGGDVQTAILGRGVGLIEDLVLWHVKGDPLPE